MLRTQKASPHHLMFLMPIHFPPVVLTRINQVELRLSKSILKMMKKRRRSPKIAGSRLNSLNPYLQRPRSQNRNSILNDTQLLMKPNLTMKLRRSVRHMMHRLKPMKRKESTPSPKNLLKRQRVNGHRRSKRERRS